MGLLWLSGLWTAAMAAPATAAEKNAAALFIEKLGTEAIESLAQPGIDRKTREDRLAYLLDRAFAIKAIAKFALGRYWRSADGDQRARYLKAFKRLIIKTYAGRFELYAGEPFRVLGQRNDGSRGYLVESHIIRSVGPPVKIVWRLRPRDASFRIIDVMIEGVSMVITQRSEYSSVIRKKGGSVEGLIQELEAKIDALDKAE